MAGAVEPLQQRQNLFAIFQWISTLVKDNELQICLLKSGIFGDRADLQGLLLLKTDKVFGEHTVYAGQMCEFRLPEVPFLNRFVKADPMRREGQRRYVVQPRPTPEVQVFAEVAPLLAGQLLVDELLEAVLFRGKLLAALEHNGVEVDPHSIFDVQVKRLHEYKRQLLNILHVIYLYNQIKMHPEMEFYPRTFIFGAKASAGYATAKKIIKLINSVADVVNNDASINGKIKVVFIENYRVSNAEWIFAAADVSEQISTASKEASGTGNMKFMLNGAPTLGTMDGANVEIVQEVGEENAFIFGLSAQEVINYENNGGYNPMDYFNNDQDIRRVLMQLINGEYAPDDPERFRDIYDSLLNTNSSDRADTYFILADFKSYAEAQERVEKAYRDETGWARMAMMNTACSGKFTSDRTIQQYVDEIWHLDKVTVEA